MKYSIYNHLAVAFAAVVGAVVLGVLIGGKSFHRFVESDCQITTAYNYMLALRDVEAEFREYLGDVENVLLTDKNEEKAKLGGVQKELENRISKLEELRPQERDPVQLFSNKIKEWRAAAEIDLNMMLSRDETRSIRNSINDILLQLSSVEKERIASLAVEKDRALSIVELTSLGCVSISLLIAIIACISLVKSIQRPIVQLTAAVGTFASGDLTGDVPAVGCKGEIGSIARAILGFRDELLERTQLREQTETAVRAQRQEALEKAIGQFDTAVQEILNGVKEKTERMSSVGDALTTLVGETTGKVTSAASASKQTSANVESVSGAIAELSASISEIARTSAELKETAEMAEQSARSANNQISDLRNASEKIGNIINVIRAIASQTNLLSLNATIEASRAGEAGRGFAIVASEVKTLAGRTASATYDVENQVGAIQTAMSHAVEAVEKIAENIDRVSRVASNISSAVALQERTTHEIGRNMHEAADGARHVNRDLWSVSESATRASAAASEMDSVSTDVVHHTAVLRGAIDEFLMQVTAN